MPEIIQITEVHGRANGGISAQPFRCLGEDSRQYYVKLGNAHPRGLVAEWLCGHLGKAMGLPVADFSLVRVDPDFAKALPSEFSELGHGIGFGSVAAPFGNKEVVFSDLASEKHAAFLAQLLAFDAWIRNCDRILGKVGGNPNLLVVPGSDKPFVVIDHDSAFDQAFDSKPFLCDHLGRDQSGVWSIPERRREWLNQAKEALSDLGAHWESLPEEWLFDRYGDARLDRGLDDYRAILEIPTLAPDEFWEILAPR